MWLRKGPSPHRTALAMIGAKAGDRALVVGAGDGGLPAELALTTGLNGCTLVVDDAEGAQVRTDAAAAKAGALVEFEAASATRLPWDEDGFDVVVIQGERLATAADRVAITREAARVARPGGRVLVIGRLPPRGWLGAKPPATSAQSADDVRALTEAGLRGVRVLAEVDGAWYVEGTKPRPSQATTSGP